MLFLTYFGRGKGKGKYRTRHFTSKGKEKVNRMNVMMSMLAVVLALGIYPETMIVVSETDPITGYTVLQDFNGNQWEIYLEDSDWFPGDVVSCIMDSKGTEEICDDEFVRVRYSGYIEGWEMLMLEQIEHEYE